MVENFRNMQETRKSNRNSGNREQSEEISSNMVNTIDEVGLNATKSNVTNITTNIGQKLELDTTNPDQTVVVDVASRTHSE